MDRDAWNRRYAEAQLLWTAEPSRFVASELYDLAPGRALDLAAGEGKNALWLAKRGWQVDAVDCSRVAVERGRQLAEELRIQGISWTVADVLECRLDPRTYDLVLLTYLHRPRPRMRRVWHRAAEAVRDGGVFLSVGHDETNLRYGYGGPRDPELLYGPDDVATELQGLEVLKAYRASRPVEVEGAIVYAIDNVVRAMRPGRAFAWGSGEHSRWDVDSSAAPPG